MKEKSIDCRILVLFFINVLSITVGWTQDYEESKTYPKAYTKKGINRFIVGNGKWTVYGILQGYETAYVTMLSMQGKGNGYEDTIHVNLKRANFTKFEGLKVDSVILYFEPYKDVETNIHNGRLTLIRNVRIYLKQSKSDKKNDYFMKSIFENYGPHDNVLTDLDDNSILRYDWWFKEENVFFAFSNGVEVETGKEGLYILSFNSMKFN